MVKNRRHLTPDERKQVISDLLVLASVANDAVTLASGAIAQISAKHKCNERTIQRLWKSAKKCYHENGHFYVERKFSKGRPLLYNREDLVKVMEELPSEKKRTQRVLAKALGVSQTTVHNLIHKTKETSESDGDK